MGVQKDQHSDTPPQAPYPQLVLFGDSLFQGCSDIQDGFSFQGALQNRECQEAVYAACGHVLTSPFSDCMRRIDVVNRGFSGYNTSQSLKIIENVFPAPTPSGPKLEILVSHVPRLAF